MEQTTIIQDIVKAVKGLRPAWFARKPHFTFISTHYFYIIGMTILGSICLYPNGNMHYIDALFFASGAATQSGLNTIDVNLLSTWQQIVLTFSSLLCNPIAINSAVVVVRLIGFEKRFQHVVKSAKIGRKSFAKSFTKSKTQDRDLEAEERGVGDRRITVMHNTTRANGMTNRGATTADLDNHMQEKEKAIADEKDRSSDDTSTSRGVEPGEEVNGEQRQIKFADQVSPSQREAAGIDPNEDRLPAPRSKEAHIAILQRQRNADDGAVLRIPGPRDADAGVAPQPVGGPEVADGPVSHVNTLESNDPKGDAISLNDDQDEHSSDERPKRGITIETPPTHQHSYSPVEDVGAFKHAITSVLRLRKPRIVAGTKLHESETHHSHTFQTIRSALSRERTQDGMPYLSWEATVGRNSMFIDLNEAQREELGGIEYRSLKTLLLILFVYFWGFLIFGSIGLIPWILHREYYGSIVTADGQGRPWWGVFTASSAFTDLGFTLTPDSMISFQTAIWPLLLLSFLIIIGNTGFPIMLRIIIWVTAQWVPKDSGIWEELKFLLDHPRRCFTLLFPAKATWWLLWILVVLNGVDLLFFIILDLGNTIVTSLPVNIRVLDGWFQAVSTRTAGFGVVNLAELHPAIQVSYMVMMYISVLPIAISVRRTNVYEENSLGIYASPEEENQDEGEPSYVGAHLRRQLSFDLWYICLGIFIIAIAEGPRLQSGDPAFTMFTVLFEVISAYGTVGLSLGYTGINASFSAEFGVVAKLVIIAMQIRGRHRGLPYELDKAILLPSEHLLQKEAADAAKRGRRMSQLSIAPMNTNNTHATGITRRSRSRERAGNLWSSLLQPGPSVPNSHRTIHKGDPLYDHGRNYSVASKKTRRDSIASHFRHESPGGNTGRNIDGAGDDEDRIRGRSGRRHFYEEGVNPMPKEELTHLEGVKEQ